MNLLLSFMVLSSDIFQGLQVTTESMLEHIGKLLQIPGSKLLFGGEPLQGHSIPKIYGAMKPTAVFIPIEEMLKEDNFGLVTKEIFGPFQVAELQLNQFFVHSYNIGKILLSIILCYLEEKNKSSLHNVLEGEFV